MLLCGAGTFCSPGPKKKSQTVDCYVRYLVPEAQLHAELTLREGPPGQAAQNPAAVPGGIRYQGVLMNELSGSEGASYRLDRSGGYNPQHVFSWTDDLKKAQQFRMELSPITAFSFGSATLSRQSPATFTWEGAPLEKGEVLVFLWETVDRLNTVPMEVIATPGQQRIEFPAAKLAELKPGVWTLYLVRKKLTKADVEGVKMTGIAEFYSRVDTLTIR